MNNISKILKQWRNVTGHNQETAAVFLGVKLSRLQKWEQCKHLPDAIILESILKKINSSQPKPKGNDHGTNA